MFKPNDQKIKNLVSINNLFWVQFESRISIFAKMVKNGAKNMLNQELEKTCKNFVTFLPKTGYFCMEKMLILVSYSCLFDCKILLCFFALKSLKRRKNGFRIEKEIFE